MTFYFYNDNLKTVEYHKPRISDYSAAKNFDSFDPDEWNPGKGVGRSSTSEYALEYRTNEGRSHPDPRHIICNECYKEYSEYDCGRDLELEDTLPGILRYSTNRDAFFCDKCGYELDKTSRDIELIVDEALERPMMVRPDYTISPIKNYSRDKRRRIERAIRRHRAVNPDFDRKLTEVEGRRPKKPGRRTKERDYLGEKIINELIYKHGIDYFSRYIARQKGKRPKIREGLTIGEVAKKLNVSEDTIERHAKLLEEAGSIWIKEVTELNIIKRVLLLKLS